MRATTRRRVLLAVVLAAMNVVVPIHRPVTSVLAAATTTICVEGLFGFFLDAFGSPGEIQIFQVTSNPTGHVQFARTTAGPFTDSVNIVVTIGSSGSTRTQFIARGTAVGTTVLTATNTETGEQTNTLDITVDRVSDISFEPADADHVLEDDPFDPEVGALRFFPDLDTPTDDATQSRQLAVKASLELGSPGVNVQFRFADVDDPSTDTEPADPNGPVAVDNRGDTSISSTQVQSDDTGVATVDIRLPMQPGDNVKLVASCAAGYLNGVTVSGLDIRDSSGRTLPTPAGIVSDMITTWRRLHIETDSMGAVQGNFVEGDVGSSKEVRIRLNGVSQVPVTQLKLNSMFAANGSEVPRQPVDQFRFGRIEIGGSVHDILSSKRDLVYIAPGHAGLVGAYTMVDDDNLNGQKTGDDGFDVPLPDMSHLEESSAVGANWFAEAFIQPVHLSGHDDVPFRLQGTDEPSALYCKVLENPCPGQGSFDNVATHANAGYWTVYLLAGYQPGLGRDGDPDDENILGGKADSIGQGAVVYMESAREGRGLGVVCEAAGLAVHELAHLLAGDGHSTSGIMTEACFDGSSSFSAESLALIRSATYP